MLSTVLDSNPSDERVNARHVSLLNPHGGQSTSSTQLITLNYLENVTLLEAKKKFKNRAALDFYIATCAIQEIFSQNNSKPEESQIFEGLSVLFKVLECTSAVILPSSYKWFSSERNRIFNIHSDALDLIYWLSDIHSEIWFEPVFIISLPYAFSQMNLKSLSK